MAWKGEEKMNGTAYLLAGRINMQNVYGKELLRKAYSAKISRRERRNNFEYVGTYHEDILESIVCKLRSIDEALKFFMND